MDNQRGLNISIISLQELMSDYEIFDEVNDQGTSIQWTKGLMPPITNTDYYLLNRVLYVPDTLFSHFNDKDKAYAQRELEAYIGFSLNAFRGVGNQLPNGTAVESRSLPQQWKIIAKECGIAVPNYYWGHSDFNHLDNKANLIYSNIYNFLNWSISTGSSNENPVFCFEKPPGEPFFILSMGNKQLITTELNLPKALKAQLQLFARRINQLFNHFISEILFFIDGTNITFGCINPEVIKSTNNKAFNNFICNNLVNEFYPCIH